MRPPRKSALCCFFTVLFHFFSIPSSISNVSRKLSHIRGFPLVHRLQTPPAEVRPGFEVWLDPGIVCELPQFITLIPLCCTTSRDEDECTCNSIHRASPLFQISEKGGKFPPRRAGNSVRRRSGAGGGAAPQHRRRQGRGKPRRPLIRTHTPRRHQYFTPPATCKRW